MKREEFNAAKAAIADAFCDLWWLTQNHDFTSQKEEGYIEDLQRCLVWFNDLLDNNVDSLDD